MSADRAISVKECHVLEKHSTPTAEGERSGFSDLDFGGNSVRKKALKILIFLG